VAIVLYDGFIDDDDNAGGTVFLCCMYCCEQYGNDNKKF
jgi:hypothetical protein